MIDDLYQEILLDYSKDGTNKGVIEGTSLNIFVKNPLCGDEIKLFLKLKIIDGKQIIEEAKFLGSGCIVSQASAAIVVEKIIGQPLESVHKIIQDYRTFMDINDCNKVRKEELGDFVALGGVRSFPSRIRCAMLSLDAVTKTLEKAKTLEQVSPDETEKLLP